MKRLWFFSGLFVAMAIGIVVGAIIVRSSRADADSKAKGATETGAGPTSHSEPPAARPPGLPVLTDEAEIVRYAYTKLKFYLQRDAAHQTIIDADWERAFRDGRVPDRRPRPKPGAVRRLPRRKIPVLELGSISTGPLSEILRRPYSEYLTRAVGMTPTVSGRSYGGATPGEPGYGFSIQWAGGGIYPGDWSAHTVDDALNATIIDGAQGFTTYATYEVRLSVDGMDQPGPVRYKALALFGPQIDGAERLFEVVDLVLRIGALRAVIAENGPLAPFDRFTPRDDRGAKEGENSRSTDAREVCPAGGPGMLCSGYVCCGEAEEGAECCWLERNERLVHPSASLPIRLPVRQ